MEYLGEKTGPAEDDLKRSLEPLLRHHHKVQRAYLAIISTDARKTWSVALCLAPELEDPRLIREIGNLFHRMFGKGQYLDILFVGHEAAQRLQVVCPPFYRRDG